MRYERFKINACNYLLRLRAKLLVQADPVDRKYVLKVLRLIHTEYKNDRDVSHLKKTYRAALDQDNEVAFCVILLNDLINNAYYSVNMLYALGFPQYILETLRLFNHDKDVLKTEYYKRVESCKKCTQKGKCINQNDYEYKGCVLNQF